jgi:hypothetical protein
MAERVTVYKTFDPGLADMLAGMLAQDGIEARVIGARGSSVFGAGQLLLETQVVVPSADERPARELVQAILAQQETNSEAAVEQELDGEPASPRRSPLSRAVDQPDRLSLVRALGVAPLVPGGAHLVARRYVTGVLLLVAQLVSLALVATGDRVGAHMGAISFLGLLAFDLVAGGLAVRAYNRGVRAGRWWQLGTATFALVGVGLVANLVAPELARRRARAGDGLDDGGPSVRGTEAGPDGVLPPLLRQGLTEGFR